MPLYRVSGPPYADWQRRSPGNKLAALEEKADVVVADQVRDGPAVQIVFGQALVREALHVVRGALSLRGEEDLGLHVLVVAGVVPLVEFMPAPNSVPIESQSSFISFTRSTASTPSEPRTCLSRYGRIAGVLKSRAEEFS